MNKFAKLLVTAGIIFVFFMLFAVVVGTRQDAGHETPGFLGLILFAAVYGAIRAVWKKDGKNNDEENNNTSILQK